MIGFPLLLIPLAIYNIVVFLMQGVSFDAPLARIALASGRSWTATFSDGLLTLGMLLLILEMIRASRPGAKYFTDHLLSFLVFAGAAAEFVLLPQFATSTFFLLTVLALVDFIASIGIRSRRQAPPRRAVKPAPKTDDRAAETSTASELAAPANPPSPPATPAQAEPVVTAPPAAEAEPRDAEPREDERRDAPVITPQR